MEGSGQGRGEGAGENEAWQNVNKIIHPVKKGYYLCLQ